MTYTCPKCGWTGEVRTRPRCLPCVRAAVKAWRKANPEKYLAQKRRGEHRARKERREQYRANRRRRRKPEVDAAQRVKRLTWLLAGDVTRADLIAIYERDKVCVYCGATVKPRFTPTSPRGYDHIVSRANGGKHTAANLCISCGPCNARKG